MKSATAPRARDGVMTFERTSKKRLALSASIVTARAQVNDLQAEIEAGARCADRIRVEATIDERVITHLQYAARLGSLTQCVRELQASIAEQRSILRDLRNSLDSLRQALREQSRV
jgi:hypothetical protein